MTRHRAEYLAGLMLAAVEQVEERAMQAQHKTGLPWPQEQREQASGLLTEVAETILQGERNAS